MRFSDSKCAMSYLYPSSYFLLASQGSTDLEHIQIIKKVGGKLTDSYLDEGTHQARFDISKLANIFFLPQDSFSTRQLLSIHPSAWKTAKS